MRYDTFRIVLLLIAALAVLAPSALTAGEGDRGTAKPDLLTPAYYLAGEGAPFRLEVDSFLARAREIQFHHPLADAAGKTRGYVVRQWGSFCALKGRGEIKHYHPATDFHVGNRETQVTLRAAYDGKIAALRDVPKYRHALALIGEVKDDKGRLLGRIVTLYAHIDLDRDEADGLALDGATVQKGDVISRNLYAGTVGGPHLHFEIRYYRPTDKAMVDFYGTPMPRQTRSDLTQPSAGPWKHGLWNPAAGYGFADPRNHGIAVD